MRIGACFRAVLSDVADRFNWTIHAYRLMSNRYHLLVETPDGNLAEGMRQLNGGHIQAFSSNQSMPMAARVPATTILTVTGIAASLSE